MMEIEKPRITCEETDNGCFARFVVEPLDRGLVTVERLKQEIDNIELKEGPQGPAGPQGPKGDDAVSLSMGTVTVGNTADASLTSDGQGNYELNLELVNVDSEHHTFYSNVKSGVCPLAFNQAISSLIVSLYGRVLYPISL